MVLKLQLHSRRWLQTVIFSAAIIGMGAGGWIPAALAETQSGTQLLKAAQEFCQRGQYFRCARYAFSAAQDSSAGVEDEAYSWVTVGLVQAGLPQSAAYFYVRTLQGNHPAATHRVLSQTEEIVNHVGVDLLRKYLISRTKVEDYDTRNQSVFHYLVGKSALLEGQYSRALEELSRVAYSSAFHPITLQLRGTVRAILGQGDGALNDFEQCISESGRLLEQAQAQKERFGEAWVKQGRSKAEDLRARCRAGLGRTYYQMNRFRDADRAYDRIPKSSLVWTDILFEQAWNAFSQQEYNRALGKLVSYKSPALKFVFNTEVDVLRAQSYLGLCLYADANDVINDFNSKYSRLGEEVKRFVEGNANEPEAFYQTGKRVLESSLFTNNGLHQMINRFIRSPYFETLVHVDREISKEMIVIERFASFQPGVGDSGRGFPAFLRRVLDWRAATARRLGGIFVKNGLIDYHSVLINDFEKMAFIKLEMLSRAKNKLMHPELHAVSRDRGNREPLRKPYQYYWTFNGEFWNDELGDYVFGLESDCDRS